MLAHRFSYVEEVSEGRASASIIINTIKETRYRLSSFRQICANKIDRLTILTENRLKDRWLEYCVSKLSSLSRNFQPLTKRICLDSGSKKREK